MEIDRALILRTFLADSEEELGQMEESLVALEASPADPELLGLVFRLAHTLKGNASLLGLAAPTELAHGLEGVLEALQKGACEPTPGLMSALLHAVDALRVLIPAAAAGDDAMPAAARALLGRLEVASQGAGAPAPAPAVDPTREAPGPAAAPAAAQPPREATLRVGLEKLDRMLDLTGELAIARGRLDQALESGTASREGLLEVHREADRLYLDLQELVMRVRMVPVGPTFRQYARTSRDLALELGKQARVVLEGEDVEVDTSVIEHLRDPLTHLVRNAVDHAIEAPADRVAAGKPAHGTITLRARHEGGNVLLEVADDGAGLDRARIAARARERGVAEADALPDAELFRLIFEAGFSTASALTEVSGRGVGMDVVRRSVEALRGSVGVRSRPGQGTTVTLRLPLTLAIIDGFRVGVGAETYVVPLDSVVECLELPAAECARSGSGVLNLRGEALPFVRLRELFELGGQAPGRENIVVVTHDGHKAGLAVDALFGDSQTVIKPLGRMFHDVRGISGSAILGNGRVALILDVPALLRGVTNQGEAAETG